jgi:hypothetical protein
VRFFQSNGRGSSKWEGAKKRPKKCHPGLEGKDADLDKLCRLRAGRSRGEDQPSRIVERCKHSTLLPHGKERLWPLGATTIPVRPVRPRTRPRRHLLWFPRIGATRKDKWHRMIIHGAAAVMSEYAARQQQSTISRENLSFQSHKFLLRASHCHGATSRPAALRVRGVDFGHLA